MNTKKNIITLLCLLSFSAIMFYVLPVYATCDTGWGITLLLVIFPISCFLCGAIYTMLIGFKWYFPLLLGLEFLPSAFIYYNESAAIYCLLFTGVAYIGCLFAWLINNALLLFCHSK